MGVGGGGGNDAGGKMRKRRTAEAQTLHRGCMRPRTARKPRAMETPDSNAGKEWSEMDIMDLRQSIKTGDTPAETAKLLRRTISEVREKAAELGLSFCGT